MITYIDAGDVMEEDKAEILNIKDFEAIEILKRLGVHRNVAILIAYLAKVNEASLQKIEHGTNMKQHEISIATRTLYRNDWIRISDHKKKGKKGQPTKIYSLCIPLNEVVNHFENVKMKEAARDMENIKKLKMIASS